MRVLGVETSTLLGSVALVVDGELRAEIAAGVRARHGETLLPRLEEVLALAGVEIGDIDLLAVGLGPGSFTGLRVGLATVKGLALSRATPVVGVASLRVLAAGLGPVEAIVAPLLDAQRGELYAGAFRVAASHGAVEVLAPFHGAPEVVAGRLQEVAGESPLVLAGGGARRHADALRGVLGPSVRWASPAHDAPRAAHLAVEAMAAHEARGPDDLAALEPLYVRPSDARPTA